MTRMGRRHRVSRQKQMVLRIQRVVKTGYPTPTLARAGLLGDGRTPRVMFGVQQGKAVMRMVARIGTFKLLGMITEMLS